jgi:hypothetical protein
MAAVMTTFAAAVSWLGAAPVAARTIRIIMTTATPAALRRRISSGLRAVATAMMRAIPSIASATARDQFALSAAITKTTSASTRRSTIP